MLARLTYSHSAYELSERLVSEAGTYRGEYGRGAFLAEEAASIVSEARALLDAAVVAGRLRGLCGWPSRRLWSYLPRRQRSGSPRPNAGSATRCCSLAAIQRRARSQGRVLRAEEPERVRAHLDRWVVEHPRSSGSDRD